LAQHSPRENLEDNLPHGIPGEREWKSKADDCHDYPSHKEADEPYCDSRRCLERFIKCYYDPVKQLPTQQQSHDVVYLVPYLSYQRR